VRRIALFEKGGEGKTVFYRLERGKGGRGDQVCNLHFGDRRDRRRRGRRGLEEKEEEGKESVEAGALIILGGGRVEESCWLISVLIRSFPGKGRGGGGERVNRPKSTVKWGEGSGEERGDINLKYRDWSSPRSCLGRRGREEGG